MGVAAETADLQVQVTGIQGVDEGQGGLRRAFVAHHSVVPGLAGKPVGLLPSFSGLFGGHPDRGAEEAFAGLGGHAEMKEALRATDAPID